MLLRSRYKIFANSWAAKSGAGSGDDDYWGTKDLSGCCGRMDVPIPANTPAGDYLLRAEVIALHTGKLLVFIMSICDVG